MQPGPQQTIHVTQTTEAAVEQDSYTDWVILKWTLLGYCLIDMDTTKNIKYTFMFV